MDDLHKMHAFINDFWGFIKTHFTGDINDEPFWLDVVDETNRITKKYENHPAVVKTMIGYLNYLEDDAREREEKKHGTHV